jgi:hemin uptake protein HemP
VRDLTAIAARRQAVGGKQPCAGRRKQRQTISFANHSHLRYLSRTIQNGASSMQQTTETTSHNQPDQLQPPSLSSRDLLRGGRRIVIKHGEARYTLLLTRNDKLILVK